MTVKLNERIVEGFVLAYLHPRFNNPANIPEFHREMWQMACSGHPRIAIAAPRDHAKSTGMTHSYTLAAFLFGVKRFGIILSSTYDISCRFLKDIKSELYSNDELIADFGPFKFTKDTEDEIIVSCAAGEFCLMARGAEQDVRGLKWERMRPDYMIFDDCESDDQVENKNRRDKFRDRILNVWLPMGSEDLSVIWVGTVMHFDSMLERLLTDSMWHSKRYQAHASFNDFSGLLWPDKWNENRLREKRQMFINQGNENGYSREYLNIPMTEKGAYFRAEDSLDMNDYDYNARDTKGEWTYIAAGDFAFTTHKKSDYTVFGVAGINSDGDVYVVDVRRYRIASDEIVEEMITITKRYDVQVFGVPGGKDWENFRPFLENRMRERMIYVPIQTFPDNKDKPSKCQTFRGFHRMGMVHFDKEADWWYDVNDEMSKFTMEGAKSGHDDIIDMLGVLGHCVQTVSRPNTDEENEELEYRMMEQEESYEGRNPWTGY